MDEYITRNNAISAVCLGCNQQFSDEPCEPFDCTIRRSIMALPTADVAPRAEVAREIFEEIEKILNDERINRKLAERGFLFVRHGEPTFEQRFAELKKKYTEGQK